MKTHPRAKLGPPGRLALTDAMASAASSSDASPSCRPLRANSRPMHGGCPLDARSPVVSA
jgi:hypothetical protein